MNAGPFDIDSRPALIAEKFAAAQGEGEAFHKAVMQAYWQQARAIDDESVLKEIAASVGLNTDDFASLLASPDFDAQVSADIEQAHEYGLDGVPALIFDDRHLVMGAQPYEVMRQVVEKVQAEGLA